jgi:hypothetical protein
LLDRKFIYDKATEKFSLENASGLTRSTHRATALGLGQGQGVTGVYSSVNEDGERTNNADIRQVRKSCASLEQVLIPTKLSGAETKRKDLAAKHSEQGSRSGPNESAEDRRKQRSTATSWEEYALEQQPSIITTRVHAVIKKEHH